MEKLVSGEGGRRGVALRKVLLIIGLIFFGEEWWFFQRDVKTVRGYSISGVGERGMVIRKVLFGSSREV